MAQQPKQQATTTRITPPPKGGGGAGGGGGGGLAAGSSKNNDAHGIVNTTTATSEVVIAGAGIVGLVLALALREHVPGIRIRMYEQAAEFHDGIGAGIGMYPNGLRVIRDISLDLLSKIQSQGYPYLFRRWERHDGTEIMCAEESILASALGGDEANNYTEDENGVINSQQNDHKQLEPLGIRRWKLQKVLYEAVLDANIPIHFKKKVRDVQHLHQQQLVELHFEDGTSIRTRLLLASDGAKSPIRTAVLAGNDDSKNNCSNGDNVTTTTTPSTGTSNSSSSSSASSAASKLTYTGTTCLYGHAKIPREKRGICFPTSETSKCHGAFFPVSSTEQCFQFHFPTPVNDSSGGGDGGGSWKSLLKGVARSECRKLAEQLKEDGWHAKYLEPLHHAEDGAVLKVPFAVLDPPLESYVYCNNRVVLLGDSAHPPTPYLGQGAQQGIEDAGTLAVLLQRLCIDSRSGMFSFQNLDAALQLYDKIRVPRSQDILSRSLDSGERRQKRAENRRYNEVKEELIKRDVFFHETTSEMFPGATYDYRQAVIDILHEEPMVPVLEEESESESEECRGSLVQC